MLHYGQLEDGWDEVEKKIRKKKRKRKKERRTHTHSTEWNMERWKLSWNTEWELCLTVSNSLSWGHHLFDPSPCPCAQTVSGSAIPQSSFKGWLTFKHPLSELRIGSAFICKLQSSILKSSVLFCFVFHWTRKIFPPHAKKSLELFNFPLCNSRSVFRGEIFYCSSAVTEL